MPMKSILLFLYSIISIALCNAVIAQERLSYFPGPANADSSQFARVYFMRDRSDDYWKGWLGVVIDENQGMCVKVYPNRVYKVYTMLKGETQFQTRIEEVKQSLTIELEAGRDYFIELHPRKREDGELIGELTLLEAEAAKARIQAYARPIQDRYCILPFIKGGDFVANSLSDTTVWYAHKKYFYSFRALPSWDFILKSKFRTVYGYRNPVVSRTYSEIGGVLYYPLRKCKSAEDFEKYCREKFVPAAVENKTDTILNFTLSTIEPPPGISHARLITIDNVAWDARISEGKALLVRSVYVIFFWTDDRGKGNTACIYESERGLPAEVHSAQHLEERLKWCWSSFRLEDAPIY
jgi:hypothetical protein